jgi:hypothetical protein
VGFLGLAFACPTPSGSCPKTSSSVTQQITVNVPTVAALVLDGGALQPWNINLNNGPSFMAQGCYVVPNPIAASDTQGAYSWLSAVAGLGELNNIQAVNYPGVFYSNGPNSAPKLWSAVLPHLPEGYGYLANLPAKGNLFCVNEFKVEKYTNCPTGATFSVSLTGSPASGFGTYGVIDYLLPYAAGMNGSDVQFSQISAGALSVSGATSYTASFTQAGGPAQTLATVPPYQFIDDYIVQWLDLGTAQPGTYNLTATYTLMAPAAMSKM